MWIARKHRLATRPAAVSAAHGTTMHREAKRVEIAHPPPENERLFYDEPWKVEDRGEEPAIAVL